MTLTIIFSSAAYRQLKLRAVRFREVPSCRILYSAMANVYLRAESYFSQTMRRRARMYNNNNNFVAVHCVSHFIQHSQYV